MRSNSEYPAEFAQFAASIDAIAPELSAARVPATGDTTPAASKSESKETPLGLADFRIPWLTLALLIVLIIVFALENIFAVTPGGGELNPSVATLVAFGALSQKLIVSDGQWYRLFTAPLLHGNLPHIIGNGIALLWGGWLLERLIGRLWFFACFTIGALGGSLFSIVVLPVNLVSVGASGALMGLFAALFVGSFRYGSRTAYRWGLQLNSLRILIPSLLPFLQASTAGRIDYGAHVGGTLSGAALALLLLKGWPDGARIPQFRNAAATVSALGALLFAASGGVAIASYPKWAHSFAIAQIQPQLAQCVNVGGAFPLATAIDGCKAAIGSGRLSGVELAWAYNNLCGYYERGGSHDQAVTACDQAIARSPKFANAFFTRGLAFRSKGDLDRAVADFTQAIALDPKNEPAFFARGRLELSTGALAKALADLVQASELNPKDPYVALWLDIASKRSGLPGQLPEAMKQIDMTKWPAPVIRLYLGELTPETVLVAANDSDAETKRGWTCEANFYTGELTLQQGKKDEAKRLMGLAAADCPKSFIEYEAALAELKALGVMPSQPEARLPTPPPSGATADTLADHGLGRMAWPLQPEARLPTIPPNDATADSLADHGPGRVTCDTQWAQLHKPQFQYRDFITNCMGRHRP